MWGEIKMNLEISQFPMNRPAATFDIFIMRKRAAAQSGVSRSMQKITSD